MNCPHAPGIGDPRSCVSCRTERAQGTLPELDADLDHWRGFFRAVRVLEFYAQSEAAGFLREHARELGIEAIVSHDNESGRPGWDVRRIR